MTEKVTVVRGPIVGRLGNKVWESNIFRLVYTVYLDSGVIVTNPDQFPEELPQEEESPELVSGT